MLLILFGINWLIVNLVFPDTPTVVTVPYTFFKQQVGAGNVIEITSRGEDIQGTFKSAVSAPPDPVAALTPTSAAAEPTAAPGPPPTFTRFATIKPAFEDVELLPLLQQNNVVITARALETARSPFLNFLFAFGPTLLLIGGFLWLQSRLSRGGGAAGAFGLGASRAKRYDANTTIQQVNFDDVAGIDEVENELVEVVDFLKNPDKYRKLGARIPRGVLLIGAPGTGKTLLARAVAGEANVPFFSMSGSEFIEMVVGVGAARVRDLFKQAREAAPSIIFIDELDAIGRQRGAGMGGGNDEREQTLNQILVEMDGFEGSNGVIIIAATNRPDVLDPALLRPGRFDRQVTVGLPDVRGREAVLNIHTKGKPLAPDVNPSLIARQTPGFAGADLANLVNEAALHAARKNEKRISMRHFTEALDKIVLGTEHPVLMSEHDRKVVAYHEAGHALVSTLLPENDPVSKVTIIPRGRALGVTWYAPEGDRYNSSRQRLLTQIAGMLGGRGAEIVAIGEITTGAENDLQRATQLARSMVGRWGMSEELGLLFDDDHSENPFLGREMAGPRQHSEATAARLDHAVRTLLDERMETTLRLLNEHRGALERIANALLEHETIDNAGLLAAMRGDDVPPPALPPAPEPTTPPAPKPVPQPRPGLLPG